MLYTEECIEFEFLSCQTKEYFTFRWHSEEGKTDTRKYNFTSKDDIVSELSDGSATKGCLILEPFYHASNTALSEDFQFLCFLGFWLKYQS